MFSPSSKEPVLGITKVLLATPSEIAVLRTRTLPQKPRQIWKGWVSRESDRLPCTKGSTSQ